MVETVIPHKPRGDRNMEATGYSMMLFCILIIFIGIIFFIALDGLDRWAAALFFWLNGFAGMMGAQEMIREGKGGKKR